MELSLLSGEYTIARYASDAFPEISHDAGQNGIVSMTWTGEECSLVCRKDRVPSGFSVANEGWSALRIEGVVDFGLVGVLASILVPLGKAGVGVFTLSTHDTDYIFVKTASLDSTVASLRGAGFVVGIK